MTSSPELRMRILTKLRELEKVEADSLEELKSKLGVADVGNTQFKKALGSLHNKYRVLRTRKPYSGGSYRGKRIYEVTCLPKGMAENAVDLVADAAV